MRPVAVHDAWEDGVHIGSGADGEENDDEEGLEVEEGGLEGGLAFGGRARGRAGRTILRAEFGLRR